MRLASPVAHRRPAICRLRWCTNPAQEPFPTEKTPPDKELCLSCAIEVQAARQMANSLPRERNWPRARV